MKMKRTLKFITLAVLLCFAGMAMVSAVPHGHDDLQGQEQCPLHAFAKNTQALTLGLSALTLAIVALFALRPALVSQHQAPRFACGLTRAPPFLA